MAKGEGSIGGMKPAREGRAIEKQWDEPIGGHPAEGPAENAALPGRRMATRIDSSLGASRISGPIGGEGNGHNDRQTPLSPANRGGTE